MGRRISQHAERHVETFAELSVPDAIAMELCRVAIDELSEITGWSGARASKTYHERCSPAGRRGHHDRFPGS